MKSSTKRRTLLAVLMAMVMSLAMAGTAFAASITITGDNVKGHTYTAYQVFSGTVADDGQLTGIRWGAGVKGDTLIGVLKNDAEKPEFAQEFAEAKTAVDVANQLNGSLNDAEFAQWFADKVAECITDGQELSLGNDDRATLAGIASGYYFIKDTGDLPNNDTATDFILRVVGDEQVNAKNGTTESDKSVEEDSLSKYQEFADAEINQWVNFKLTATVPANLASFKNYWVQLWDKMSEGLTLDANSILVRSNDVELSKGTDYVLDTIGDKGAQFTITIGNKPGSSKIGLSDKIHANDTITVTYRAKLNEDAIIGADGNLNEFKTIYSTDPNSNDGGTPGETPESVVYVFTWELDNTKIDGVDKHALAEAEFKLYRDSDKKYAKLNKNGNEYWIDEWVDGKDSGSTMVTTENGIFNIKGLDSKDVYYLEETKAPAGYNPLPNPIEVVITANGIDDNQKPTEIELGEKRGDIDAGTVSQDIENMSGSTLPSTGGMGTIIFTVVGVGVMVVAAIALITRRRKNAANLS